MPTPTRHAGEYGPTDACQRQDVQDYLAADQDDDYEVSLKPLSQWQLAWRRFRKHRMAIVGSVMVGDDGLHRHLRAHPLALRPP